MSHQEPASTSRYLLNIFAAFVTVFVFLMLIKLWHGNFYPGHPEKNYYKEVRTDI